MKMIKNIVLIMVCTLIVIFSFLSATAQNTGPDIEDVNGWHEFRIGRPFSELKHLLEMPAIESYYQRVARITFQEDEGLDVDETQIPHHTYRVKDASKMPSYLGATQGMVHVTFDEQNNLSNIVMLMSYSSMMTVGKNARILFGNLCPASSASWQCNTVAHGYRWIAYQKSTFEGIEFSGSTTIRISREHDTPEKEIQYVRSLVGGATNVPEEFMGIGALRVGEPVSTMKQYLNPGPEYDAATLAMLQEGGKKNTEPEGLPKDTWTVKSSEKQFFTFAGAKVEKIELRQDEEGIVQAIFLLIPKNEKNDLNVHYECMQKFGNTPCATGLNEKGESDGSYYCRWDKGAYEVTVYNSSRFEGGEPGTQDKYITVIFSYNH